MGFAVRVLGPDFHIPHVGHFKNLLREGGVVCRVAAGGGCFSTWFREERERGIFIRNNFCNDFVY